MDKVENGKLAKEQRMQEKKERCTLQLKPERAVVGRQITVQDEKMAAVRLFGWTGPRITVGVAPSCPLLSPVASVAKGGGANQRPPARHQHKHTASSVLLVAWCFFQDQASKQELIRWMPTYRVTTCNPGARQDKNTRAIHPSDVHADTTREIGRWRSLTGLRGARVTGDGPSDWTTACCSC